mgnify:CR=1 FL=1
MKSGSEKMKFSPQNHFKTPQINQIGVFPMMIYVFMKFLLQFACNFTWIPFSVTISRSLISQFPYEKPQEKWKFLALPRFSTYKIHSNDL